MIVTTNGGEDQKMWDIMPSQKTWVWESFSGGVAYFRWGWGVATGHPLQSTPQENPSIV